MTTTAAPTAAGYPTLSAADGSNVRACSDGRCQIEVTDPVAVRVGSYRLVVARLAGAGMQMQTEDGSTTVSGSGGSLQEPGAPVLDANLDGYTAAGAAVVTLATG